MSYQKGDVLPLDALPECLKKTDVLRQVWSILSDLGNQVTTSTFQPARNAGPMMLAIKCLQEGIPKEGNLGKEEKAMLATAVRRAADWVSRRSYCQWHPLPLLSLALDSLLPVAFDSRSRWHWSPHPQWHSTLALAGIGSLTPCGHSTLTLAGIGSLAPSGIRFPLTVALDPSLSKALDPSSTMSFDTHSLAVIDIQPLTVSTIHAN